jgi:hypothetical protein
MLGSFPAGADGRTTLTAVENRQGRRNGCECHRNDRRRHGTVQAAFRIAVVTLALAVVVAMVGAIPAGAAAPDPARTPGVTDPGVTPTSLTTTICGRGGANPTRVPAKLRAKTFARYHVNESQRDRLVIDQLVPASLGGLPTRRNLWPQPRAAARTKDATELAVHDLVCAGLVDLATAQQAITADWTTAGQVAQQAADARTASFAAYLAAVEEARRQQELAAYLASLPPPTTTTSAPRAFPQLRFAPCPQIDPGAPCLKYSSGCTFVDGVEQRWLCWAPKPPNSPMLPHWIPA